MILNQQNLSIFGLTKIENNNIVSVTPLKGGVSCEIYRVDTKYKSYCVKKLVTLGENTVLVDKPEGALPLMEYDNERLEFLGDRVIGLVLSKIIVSSLLLQTILQKRARISILWAEIFQI